jgi:hypothetical protein
MDFAILFDMSAYARGGHYSSCHYNCGWNLLNGFALIVLVPILYQLAKWALTGMQPLKDYGVAAGVLSFCVLVTGGALFLGPLLVVVLIGGAIVLFAIGASSWSDWQKTKRGKS